MLMAFERLRCGRLSGQEAATRFAQANYHERLTSGKCSSVSCQLIRLLNFDL